MTTEATPLTSVLLAGVVLMLVYTFAEFGWLAFVRKRAPFRSDFLQPLKNLGFTALCGAALKVTLPLLAVAGMAAIGAGITSLALPDSWLSWIAALLIYEFWYWVQHFFAHKVRLLWCIHSPHHAPNTVNMLVGTNHHVFEGLLYFPIFFGFFPALCGVPVEMIVVINLVDTIWGSLLHVSPDIVRRRYGPLEYILQTPSYHRVHHAQNLRYMDKNYTSITLFWDWLLGTREPLRDEEPVNYGITRDVDVTSFRDVQFGEFAALWRDVRAAPGVLNKLCYLLMPPGWSHTGDHQTVSVQQRAFLDRENTS